MSKKKTGGAKKPIKGYLQRFKEMKNKIQQVESANALKEVLKDFTKDDDLSTNEELRKQFQSAIKRVCSNVKKIKDLNKISKFIDGYKKIEPLIFSEELMKWFNQFKTEKEKEPKKEFNMHPKDKDVDDEKGDNSSDNTDELARLSYKLIGICKDIFTVNTLNKFTSHIEKTIKKNKDLIENGGSDKDLIIDLMFLQADLQFEVCKSSFCELEDLYTEKYFTSKGLCKDFINKIKTEIQTTVTEVINNGIYKGNKETLITNFKKLSDKIAKGDIERRNIKENVAKILEYHPEKLVEGCQNIGDLIKLQKYLIKDPFQDKALDTLIKALDTLIKEKMTKIVNDTFSEEKIKQGNINEHHENWKKIRKDILFYSNFLQRDESDEKEGDVLDKALFAAKMRIKNLQKNKKADEKYQENPQQEPKGKTNKPKANKIEQNNQSQGKGPQK